MTFRIFRKWNFLRNLIIEKIKKPNFLCFDHSRSLNRLFLHSEKIDNCRLGISIKLTEYNIDFQILDMRWGISNELTNAHMATTICLDEVKKCQKYSLGPNFIVL